MRRTGYLWISTYLLLAMVPAMVGAQEEGELAGTSEAWIAAFNAGDAAAIAAMMTEDGELLPPNADPIVGREAIEAYWSAVIASGLQGSLEPVESHTDGDLGYKQGTFELTMDGEVADHGKWIEVWKKVDGEWLLHRDIYNSSVAMETEDAEPSE